MPRRAKVQEVAPPAGASVMPKMMLRQEFARELSRRMMAKGWNQAELARKSDIDKASISYYLQGKQEPETSNAAKLAKALGCDVVDLYPEAMRRTSENRMNSIDMRVSQDQPNRAFLTINREMPLTLAAQIIAMINSEDEARKR